MTISIRLDKIRYRPDDGKLYFTHSDVQRLPEWPESPLIELTSGELFVVPSPSTRHQRVCGNLYYLLRRVIEPDDLGFVFVAPTDVKLSEEDLVVPDILFVSKSRGAIVKEKFVEGAPDLIIEVLSSNARRDRVEKYRIYMEFGVPEYLIVDPKGGIEHHVLNEKGRYETVTVTDAVELRTLNCKLGTDEIFA